MKRLALIGVLTCVLSGVARAGEIPSTGATAPQPPPPVTTTGEVPSTGATTPPSSTVLTIILTFISIVR